MKLTPLMRDILVFLNYEPDRAFTPNVIGYGVNAKPVHGNGRSFGPAQQIIFPLTRLRELGLVLLVSRPDGRSGTAYIITDTGKEALYQDTRRRT